MSANAFEIDFFPVGNGQKSGDAIVVRFNTPEGFKVMVYDGGTRDSGAAIVKHVRDVLKLRHVDYVVNTHPDGDHASGLSVVLEELEVGELWMHQPWKYSAEIRDYFHDGRITDNSLKERLQDKMSAAYALEKLAIDKKISIKEPFQGASIGGVFKILSPGENWYTHELIQEFAKSPEQKQAVVANESVGFFKAALEKVVEWVKEKWDYETLKDDVCTSAENESSVVLFGQLGGNGVLLTGDAGIRALAEVATYAESIGLNLPALITFAQVPHHGSRNNVSTPTMNRVFGKPLAQKPEKPTRSAFISASKVSEKHPDSAVSNAFIRRGFGVTPTKGSNIRHYRGLEKREGWGTPEQIQFSEEVRAW